MRPMKYSLNASSTALVLIFMMVLMIGIISLSRLQAIQNRSLKIADKSLGKEIYFQHNLKLLSEKDSSLLVHGNEYYRLTNVFFNCENCFEEQEWNIDDKPKWQSNAGLNKQGFLLTKLHYSNLYFQRLYLIRDKQVLWSQDWYADFPPD